MTHSTKSTSTFHNTIVGLVGNVMEWYDFAVYGFFAATIGKLFFPSDNPVVSLIASFGTFAAGFLVRPLGGLVFGRIGDMVGRHRAMYLSVVTMAVPTLLMGLLPTYATIGIWAPILLVLTRLIQGLSVGGEYTSSLVYMVEQAPNGKRAFSAMWGSWGATLGTLLGSAVGFSVASILTQEEMVSWGWRLSFIMGGFVAMLGLWLRRGHEEEHPVSQSKAPQKDIFTKHRWAVMRVALLNIGNAVAFYTIFVYAVSFLEQVVHFSDQKALRNNSIAMAFILLVMPLSAKMADRYGRKNVLLVGFLMLTLSAIPLFHVIAQGIRWVTISCHLALSLGLGIVSGAIAAANVELMPRDIRCTGLAFSYNLSVGVFGGLTPLVITWLTEYLNNPSAPGYWVAGASLISLLTLLFSVKETQNNPL
ncbi:MAG: Proline/betaine transporter [Bacteroidota bacterium]|jgi:MHS family proline/betaine transporter-like MFS transporter